LVFLIEIHGVGVWKWNVQNEEVCGICRMSYESCCPDCKFPGDDCPPVWGGCGHALHVHCIMKWLQSQVLILLFMGLNLRLIGWQAESNKQECPMCRQEWTFKEEEKDVGLEEIKEEIDQDDEMVVLERGRRRREEDLSFLDEEEEEDEFLEGESSFIIATEEDEDGSYEVDYASFLLPDPL